MKHTILKTFLVVIISLLLSTAHSADLEKQKVVTGKSISHPEFQFWFEDNNMRKAGGYPPDFEQMFREPEQWDKLRSLIDVYYMRGNTFNNLLSDMGEDFVRNHFIKVLNDSEIPIAIDNLSHWEKVLPLMEEYGAKVIAISLQSSLSKRVNHRTKNLEEVMDERIAQVIQEVGAVQKAYPQLSIGIIDALPTKGVVYKEAYRKLLEELEARGLKLSYIHLDCPMDIAQEEVHIDWNGAKEVERFVKNDLGLDYGFICTSNGGGMGSDQLFYENVIKIPDLYPVEGSLPDHFILMSWYPYPSKSLPEDAKEGQYPMTKTGLHLAERLQRMAGQ